MRIRVAVVSVVPSPYQRDLFRALAARPEVDLGVHYMEAAAPDSPWPEKPLADYERIMPGFWFSLKGARCHVNWSLPDVHEVDVVIMNTLMSVTGQWLMRGPLRRKPWIFWGERQGGRGAFNRHLSSPLHQASGIAAIGTVAQRDYQERFPEPRSFCIPYYCDLTAFLAQPRPAKKPGVTTFLLCGQMIARKGVDLLLQAFATLGPTAHLLLVGREAELPQLLSPLPPEVRERITYAGFQAPDALPRFFAQADVFVLPSRYDGWGVVVNQALGAGLPIICSDAVGAAHDLVESGINGLIFRNGDTASLAEAMRLLADHSGGLHTWGEASRAKATQWSPEAGAAKWVEALQQVLSR